MVDEKHPKKVRGFTFQFLTTSFAGLDDIIGARLPISVPIDQMFERNGSQQALVLFLHFMPDFMNDIGSTYSFGMRMRPGINAIESGKDVKEGDLRRLQREFVSS